VVSLGIIVVPVNIPDLSFYFSFIFLVLFPTFSFIFLHVWWDIGEREDWVAPFESQKLCGGGWTGRARFFFCEVSLLCFVSHMPYPSGLSGKESRIYRLDYGGLYFGGLYFGGPYFGGHSFVSGGYVLAKEGIGKVCNAPEGMGKVFSIDNTGNVPTTLITRIL